MFDYNFDETFWNEYDEDEELYWNNANNKIFKNNKIKVKMEKLVCTNPKNYNLTLNKEYPIVIDEGETVKIVNDNNKTVRYYKDLFEEVVEEEEVIPEPEPEVIARTEQDLIDSITHIDAITKFIGFDNEEIVINNSLNILRNSDSFSCGVKNLMNIGSQVNVINNIVENLEVDSEEDLPLLHKALIIAHFKNYMRHKLNNGYNAGIYLMSTNVTNNEYIDEETFEIFDEMSDFKSEPELNPNSNNEIKVWGFYKSNL
jgi:hypothetical protein